VVVHFLVSILRVKRNDGSKTTLKPATAANNGNHDPRLFYIVVLGSSRVHYITPRKDARDNVIAVYYAIGAECCSNPDGVTLHAT
jgi:hypothetical protein